MIQVKRIGHATLQTPDIGRLVDYYTTILGFRVVARTEGQAILATGFGQEVVTLLRGETAGCIRLSMQLTPGSDLGEAAVALRAHGIDSQIETDPSPGLPAVLTFTDPKGTVIELFSDWKSTTTVPAEGGINPLKFGHVAFTVPDVQMIVDFYVRVLGFRVSDWMEDFFAFLRCGPDHHAVNFVRTPKTTLHHMAFELRDFAHVQTACDFLGVRDVPIIWGPGRHGIGHNVFIYHRNPDDQIIELYTQIDLMNEELGYFEPRPWHKDVPQRPKVWDRKSAMLTWGPPPTPEYLRSRE